MSEQRCPICDKAREGHEIFVTTAAGEIVACLGCYHDHPVLITARHGQYTPPIKTLTVEELIWRKGAE